MKVSLLIKLNPRPIYFHPYDKNQDDDKLDDANT